MLFPILENIPQAIVVVDNDNHISAANRSMIDFFGLGPSIFKPGTDFIETLHELARSTCQDHYVFEEAIACIRSAETFSQNYRQLTGGQYRWYKLHHNPLPEGGYVCTFTDVSDLKEAERKYRESAHTLRQTFASLNEAIFIVETATRTVLDCNVAATKMFGYSYDKLIGANTTILHVSDEKSAQFLSEMLRAYENNGYCETLFQMKRSDGSIFDSEHTVTPIIDDNGTTVRHVCVVRDISERIKSQISEKMSQERYRAIVNAFDGLIYICTHDYKVSYMNENLIKRTGRNALGERCYKVLHERDSVCPWCVNDRVKNGETVRWEVKSPKDGRWSYVVNTPILNADGSVSKQSMILDITDRKRMELELFESEQRFRTFWEKSPIAIWEEDFSVVRARFDHLIGLGITDIGAYLDAHPEEVYDLLSLVKIVDVNQRSLDLLGAASKDELVRELPRYFNEASFEIFKGEMVSLAQGKTSFECEIPIISRSGDVLQLALSLVVLPGHEHNLDRVLVSFIDITEKKNIATSLWKSERDFRWIFEQAVVGIAVVSLDLQILKVNRILCELLGYSEDDLKKMTVEEITHTDDREMTWKNIKNTVTENLPGIDFEKRYITKDGSTKWVHVHTSLLRDERGVPINFMGIVLDISSRKQAEYSMKEYQDQLNSLANELTLAEERERRKLASGLHDQVIQNLAMGKIILSEKLGMETSEECRSVHEKLWKILDSTIRDSRKLIFDLSPPLLYDLGLGAAVDELGSRMGQEYGFSFEIEEKGDCSVLEEALTVSLYQMIRELLLNVVKHAKAIQVAISIVCSVGAVNIVVKDNGIGIEPSKVPGLFRTRDSFGLFSIHQRINSLGGSITIKTSITAGTSVTLNAPSLNICTRAYHTEDD